MSSWSLNSIEICGGFLEGVRLHFPVGLTCVIGPRGSGKSTLTEAIRYGIAGLTGASKSRTDMIQANLGTASITLRAAITGSSHAIYTIRRTFRQSGTLLNGDGISIPSVDLDRGSFLPIDGFSSTEIEAIADENLGERRRALLDELNIESLREVQLRIADLRRSLEANADRIKATRRLIGDLKEQAEEIGDARIRLQALPQPSVNDMSTSLTRASKQRSLNARELIQVDAALKQLADCHRDLVALNEAHSYNKYPILSFTESKNVLIGKEADNAINVIAESLESSVVRATELVEHGVNELHNIRRSFLAAHEGQEAEHQRLETENMTASHMIQARAKVEEAITRLEAVEKSRSEAEVELTNLLEQRRNIKGNFLRERDQVSELRAQSAAELQGKAVTNVRVRVLRHADDLVYQQTLIEALRGSGLRNHEDILASLKRLRPEQLAQIIQTDDVQELELQTSLGDERCRKLLGAFQSKLDPLALEVLPTDDQICIELNVGTTIEPIFKDASDLSRGQKCTALLPLLLARRDIPLVIDQPEDNLDNHFIYETVVGTIQQMRSQRQMIFITHNANIPVLGEADFVVVMNSDGKRGYVEKAGTLDECRDEIVNLLEGGQDAFERRRQRYARD